MPEVLDWQRGDPRLVLERAVKELMAGKLVVFPTETGYQVGASILSPEALSALARLGFSDKAALTVRSFQEALHWAPWMNTTARRVACRVWPGPVTLELDCPSDKSAAWQAANLRFPMRLRVAGHKVLLGILDQLGNPLLLARAADFSRGAEAAAAYGDKVAAIIDDGETSTTQAASVVQIRGDKWTVTEVGAITETTLKAALPTLILFVCTGNTCRSPLAEALCKKLLAERLGCQLEDLAQRGFVVQSAGLAAMSGAPATPEAVEVGGEYGADLSGHCSQPLTAELLARADYLFTMTQSHLRALVLFCAQSVAEPRLLAADGHDIPDPIGAELPVYRECAAEILRNLKEWLPQIQPL